MKDTYNSHVIAPIMLTLRCAWDDDEEQGTHYLQDRDTTDHGIIGDVRDRGKDTADVVYPFAKRYRSVQAAKNAVERWYRDAFHMKYDCSNPAPSEELP